MKGQSSKREKMKGCRFEGQAGYGELERGTGKDRLEAERVR